MHNILYIYNKRYIYIYISSQITERYSCIGVSVYIHIYVYNFIFVYI